MRTAERKRALRREVRARRDRMPAEEIEARSAVIVRRVMRLASYRRARTRLLFASYQSEVRTGALIRETLRSGARLILPRVVGREEALALHEVEDPEAEVAEGRFGLPEPLASCPERSLYEIDFVLVPGLAFDRHGGRLGYGGGFYDYILNVRSDLVEVGAAVAVAFSTQIVDEVPREAWDVDVPMVITEDEVIDVRAPGADADVGR
ncbi:MAG: 5-formyltetrahydrofolate cyclo-ligase [Armatimonadota bacterium]